MSPLLKTLVNNFNNNNKTNTVTTKHWS